MMRLVHLSQNLNSFNLKGQLLFFLLPEYFFHALTLPS